jgi:hypothetical protein
MGRTGHGGGGQGRIDADVLLPDNLQRSMARQAEAERERRAKVVHARGEHQAAEELALAARIIASEPISLQLRYLQTLVEMAPTALGERSNTIIPLPLDIAGALHNLLRVDGMRQPAVFPGNGEVAPVLVQDLAAPMPSTDPSLAAAS